MNQDNPQAIIQVRDLCNRFGAQAVHEHLDLDVRRGEILGVVGGSGTGKSVLLRSIVGLRRPTSGSVRVFGEDLLQLPEERRSLVERRFGVLFQQGALFSSLTVVENVALPLIENAGLPRADAEHLAQVKLAPGRATGQRRRQVSGLAFRRHDQAAPPWPAPWRWTRTSCSSTSPPPASTRSARRPSTT